MLQGRKTKVKFFYSIFCQPSFANTRRPMLFRQKTERIFASLEIMSKKNAYICTVNRPATASTYSAPHPTMPQDCPVFQYPSHRPRYKGHDYYERGIYLITIVIAHRDPLLGKLNMDPIHPAVDLTPLGRAVEEIWKTIGSHHQEVKVVALQMMPDHLHAILFVKEKMEKPPGKVLLGVKQACNQAFRQMMPVEVVAVAQQHAKQRLYSDKKAPLPRAFFSLAIIKTQTLRASFCASRRYNEEQTCNFLLLFCDSVEYFVFLHVHHDKHRCETCSCKIRR